nr:uncharacterized protein LOC112211007 [Halyomorpha halys]
MEKKNLVRAAVLKIPGNTQTAAMPESQAQGLPPLPTTTLAAAHATTLEWIKVRTGTAQELRSAVSDLEKFTGEVGELNHFIKGGDHLIARIAVKEGENLLSGADAMSLRAAVICRIKRNILNHIQADQETPWSLVKERLKKAFGGGRWTPEEDIFRMFREEKKARQSNGQFAGILLARFNQITDKLSETRSTTEVQGITGFLSTILKVQLARETGKREGLPRERSFTECAQEMMDASAREEEARTGNEEVGWTRVAYNRPKTAPTSRRKATQSGRQAES